MASAPEILLTFNLNISMALTQSEKERVLSHSCDQLFVTPWTVTAWTVTCQAPLSMEFFRQEHWSELPFPTPGDLPDPGIEPASLVSLA